MDYRNPDTLAAIAADAPGGDYECAHPEAGCAVAAEPGMSGRSR